ncbi:10550_t:CDS:2, partial [Racocetra persica]
KPKVPPGNRINYHTTHIEKVSEGVYTIKLAWDVNKFDKKAKVSVSLRQMFSDLNIPMVAEKILLFREGKATFEKVKLNPKLLILAGMHDFKGLLNEPYGVSIGG